MNYPCVESIMAKNFRLLNMRDEELVASSPGQLPFDMPLELLMDPRHASRPRNKIIAQAFFDMGIIEHYGSGITRIKEDCDCNGNDYPEWSDNAGEFKTTYSARPNADLQGDALIKGRTKATQTTTQTTTQRIRVITPAQLSILRFLRLNPRVSRRELSIKLQNITEDGVKYNIAALKKAGLLRREGPDYGGRWNVLIDLDAFMLD